MGSNKLIELLEPPTLFNTDEKYQFLSAKTIHFHGAGENKRQSAEYIQHRQKIIVTGR